MMLSMHRKSLLPVLYFCVIVAQGQRQETLPRQVPSPQRQSAEVPAAVTSRRVDDSAWMAGMMLDGTREGLPYIQEVRSLGKGTTGITAYLSETRYVALSGAELEQLPGLGQVGAEPETHAMVGIERKRPIALVRIYP